VTGEKFDDHPTVNEILNDPRKTCMVLYPGPDSVNIEERLPDQMTSAKECGRNVVIFVIDGTWPCAKRMLKKSPRLASLPRLSFSSTKLSQYRIRKQPRSYCLSTVEAVHRVLQILEPQLDASNLLIVFQELVKAQIEFAKLNQARTVDVLPG
jgi:DTW domain-containing protein YfiP